MKFTLRLQDDGLWSFNIEGSPEITDLSMDQAFRFINIAESGYMQAKRNRLDELKAIQMNRYTDKTETTMRQPYERPRKATARKPKSKGETR